MSLEWNSHKITDLRLWLQDRVPPERFLHTEGVARMAASLAEKNGISVTRAVVAAYLHDCAKHQTVGQAAKILRDTPFQMDVVEKRIRGLWHCSVGAALAYKVWKVRDREILNAVRWHALGGADMGPLTQVLFVADYVEPNRRFKGVAKVRRIALKNLRQAVSVKCAGVLTYLVQHEMLVHPRLIETWNAFTELKRKQ
jgi:predicted HD superfamily hydrolase involved in NAD metabolism